MTITTYTTAEGFITTTGPASYVLPIAAAHIAEVAPFFAPSLVLSSVTLLTGVDLTPAQEDLVMETFLSAIA